ncbi:QRFP-like peptide receptor [Daphnia pulicaria]|uniref:QRFP-like peptide receptor n=1 Tax=Daphnia pulicaria TaxID=35523 RepID=UPI001EEBBAB0|nr:QRFP-like peptide receptor [Daphnia pulicaria]
MIVFSGPTVPSRTALQWSRLGNPLQESLWNVDQPQRSVKPFDLAKQKQVNLSDLANVTIDILCRLQILYNNNNTGDEWVWELSDVNISDIVDALGLDGYVALSDVIVLPLWFKILMTLLFVGCLIWACISNVRMLVAIGIRRSSWSKTNVLIGALALSDLLTVSCATPTEISFVINDLNVWNFGQLGCVSFPFLQSAAILSNALILCLIAYDRYVCVVKMHPNAINQKPGWSIVGSIITVWIVSIGIALPSFWIWRVYYFILVDDIPDPEIGMDFCSVFPTCNDNSKLGPKVYPAYHIMLCGAIFVPLFLLFVVLYGRIGHFLWVRSPIGTGDSSNLQLARKKRIAWALFWLVFWFFFCRMPNWIFVVVTMFVDEEQTSGLQMLKSTLVFLSVLNTLINPWLYSQLNEPLKKNLKSCNEKLCGQISSLYCCGTDSKIGLQDEQEQQNQVEPEEPRVVQQQPNEVAIFTLANKQVHVDVVTLSSSKNKTRQTYLE